MSVPHRIAAVPAYIASNAKSHFQEAAPGHKFLGYFRNWQGSDGDFFAPYKGKAHIIGQPAAGQAKREANAQLKAEFDAVLNEVCELPATSKAQIAALRARQQALIAHYGPSSYRISTTSTSPFATGLGNEHPIENGFAFLTPYGLPYLAGSGVKGIVRRAMQELHDEGEEGFSKDTIDALFGPENTEDARRGALDFWDVFPSPAGGKLTVEIMTLHHGGYYQDGDTPHDSGAPVPVSFLAVPAKSAFDFHVVCHTSRLPTALQDAWRALLDRAFGHAFEWVGFGAKTSVGYGAMNPVQTIAVRATAAPAHADTPDNRQTWPAAKLTLNPSTGEIKASFGNKTTAGLKGSDADKLRATLSEEQAAKLKKNKELKSIGVMVQVRENHLLLLGLATS